jgi:hypothetical protein
MSFEDLERARAERAAKESVKEAKKAAKEAKKAVYGSKSKEALLGKKSRVRKRSTTPRISALEPKVAPIRQATESEQEINALGIVTWVCEGQVEQCEFVRLPQRAPIAPM